MRQYYREFTCIECGGKGIDRGVRQNAIYCSPKCAHKHYVKNMREMVLCNHNEGVVCNNQQCDGCGWNPEVHKARKEKIMEGEDYGR